jgi:1-acyl-sn-glycerol-3-phosphate acyltransferase
MTGATLTSKEKTGVTLSGTDLGLGLPADAYPSAEGYEQKQNAPAVADTACRVPWQYRWGQVFRVLGLPLDLLLQALMPRMIVLGRPHLRDISGPAILAGTHRSLADTPLVRHALRSSGQRGLLHSLVVTAAAEGWRKARVLHEFGALAFGLFPVHQRGMKLRPLAGLLESGHSLLIYPQGGYASHSDECDGSPRARFRLGVGYLTVATGVPVVPFGLAGTEAVVSPALAGKFRGRSFFRAIRRISPGPMAIAFGPPLHPRPGETPRAFTIRLQQTCHELTEQAQQALAQP